MTTDGRPSLLLVEDDVVLGPLIAELLDPDYRIQLATNGRDGLHLALTRTWDVLVIDRGLPVMDGVALIAALRSRGFPRRSLFSRPWGLRTKRSGAWTRAPMTT
ncbi:response regulator [Pseudarthrobacter sp. So.54]